MFLSVSGHSSELSIAHHSPRSTVSQLKCVADRGCLFTELRFPAGFRVGFSSWIFELDFRVRNFWRHFFGEFVLVGFPIKFQWFYTTYFVSGVAHCLEVFSRWRRKRIAGFVYPIMAFVIVFLT